MEPDLSRVVVIEGVCDTCHTIHSTHAYHRDYPEIQAEGDSAADVAARLVNKLAAVLDSAVDHRHREAAERAIVNVKAFADGKAGDFDHRHLFGAIS